MQLNICIPIEQLIHLKRDDQAEGIYSEYNSFIVSWVNHHILSICARQQIPDSAENGKMLALLWEHQMCSLEEWHCIQITLNRNGYICFLCRIHEDFEEAHAHIIGVIKMIDDFLQSQIF